MFVRLPELPYPRQALSPHISEETLDFHYGKHHKTYVDKLNASLEARPDLQKASLEDLISESQGAIFNNAAQVFNHTFYWHCMSEKHGLKPSPHLTSVLEKHFGSVEEFKKQFSQTALGQFGSGWAWLVRTPEDKLKICSTSNADTPLTSKDTPLLTCDVWEHAYYIDYRNKRPEYLKAFWELVHWEFVEKNLQTPFQFPKNK